MKYQQAIRAYVETFDESPPIREMDEADAIDAIEQALENGEPMTEVLADGMPSDALQ